jgi:hypothetical protein
MTARGKRERKLLQTAGALCFLTITIYCTRREERGELDGRTKMKHCPLREFRGERQGAGSLAGGLRAVGGAGPALAGCRFPRAGPFDAQDNPA